MANRARRGSECAPIPERHGRTGEIALSLGIRPALKDALIDAADAEGVTLKEVVVSALERHVADCLRGEVAA